MWSEHGELLAWVAKTLCRATAGTDKQLEEEPKMYSNVRNVE